MVRIIGIAAAVIVVVIIALTAFRGGETEATVDAFPEIHGWMTEELRAMPGYGADPETFDEYFAIAHPQAAATVFGEQGRDPNDPDESVYYVAEVYRLMLDQAFTQSRTDLTDILTRAYMAVVRETE